MTIAHTICRPIDSIRGIFAVLIILHHYLPVINIPYHYDFGNTIVLFFFVLSGFHITLTYKDKIVGNSRRFLVKRCAKIFPLQWLTLLLFVAFGVNLKSLWAIPFHLTLTQSINPFWYINFSLNTPSWFLSSLFFCYLLTPWMLNMGNKNTKGFIIVQISVILLFTILLYVASKYIGLRWLAYISPFFRIQDFSIGMTLGFLWGKYNQHIEVCQHKVVTNTLLEILVIILISLCMTWTFLSELNPYKILRYPVIAAFIIVFTLSRGAISRLLTNRVTGWLGNISISIYMIHSFILHFTKNLMDIPTWCNVGITFALILIVSHAISRYFLPFGSKFLVQMVDKFFVTPKKII